MLVNDADAGGTMLERVDNDSLVGATAPEKERAKYY